MEEQLGYNHIITKSVCGEEINYGILLGNEKIVFIKTGADGNINGYKNKYPKMAHRIHERIGATVICASNPYIKHGHEAADQAIISQIASEAGYDEYEMYLVGTSDGANHNFALAKNIPQTTKLLGINTSSISFNNLAEKLEGLSHIKKILVYGTKDDEYAYAHLLQNLKCCNLEIVTIDGADHQFTGMLNEFIALIDLL